MSERGEGERGRSGRKSCCLLGCLGVAFAGFAMLLGGGAWMGNLFSRFDEAEELRGLREELAAARSFEPWADGRVPPERLAAFLRVRTRVIGACGKIDGVFGAIEALQERERRGEEPGFREGLSVAGAALQLPGLLADYFEARNRALLEEEMSFDEWRLLVTLAYRSGGGTFLPEGVEAGRSSARGSSGDRELVRRLLVRQLEAARTAGAEAVGEDWLAALEAEVSRLGAAEAPGWPWPEGLPERVRESLAPRGEDLLVLHCRAGEQFELDEVERDGMSVQVH